MTRALVVGSGIAGLTLALHAARAGVSVTLVTKDVLEHSNTRFAQGGVAGVMFADDREDDHAHDTLTAAAGLGDPDAVEVLVREGPARIRELIALGVAFDRDDTGALVKGLEAAHSYPRVLHAGGDATGTAIEQTLVGAVREAGIEIIEHAFLVDLVVESGAVVGADLLVGGERRALTADAVVLATGGVGQLYAHTTNPAVATGDGIAAAMRAGAAVADLEFVQFHPTVLAEGEPFLISEAVRGEGALVVDDTGRRFLFDAHPDGELAPRDVVARAIAQRMSEQGGRPVLLDATQLGAAHSQSTASLLARRFPTISAALAARGFDWAHEALPVTPAAHYLMGGVVVDLDGRSTLPGLYAIGEVARTGVHGANRLASNSLLEGAVFGARAAAALAHPSVPASAPWPAPLSRFVAPGGTERRFATGERKPEGATAAGRDGHGEPYRNGDPDRNGDGDGAEGFTRQALQHTMWEHVGVLRDAAGLERARDQVTRWLAEPRTPRTVAEFEDENLLQVAAATIDAALARRHSVGAHHRRDDPSDPIPTARQGDATLVGSVGC